MRLLFRPEAVDAQRQASLGCVLAVRPASLSALTAGVVAMAIAFALFLSLTSYTRRVSASGVVQSVGGQWLAQLDVADGPARLVRPGQAVRLWLEPPPGGSPTHFTGRVSSVLRHGAGESPAASGARISVLLDAAPGAAPVAGTPVRADVMLERRRLAQWLFDPLPGPEGPR